MAIANRKQEEMKEMIVETLGSMKEQLLDDAANLEFTGQCVIIKAGRASPDAKPLIGFTDSLTNYTALVMFGNIPEPASLKRLRMM